MRTIVHGSLSIALIGMLAGCASSTPPKPDVPAASATADAGSVVLQSGGAGVLKLVTPDNTKAVSSDGFLKLTAPMFELEVWLVPGAKTIDDGVAAVNKQIVSEFKDLKPDQTTDLTIAGAPAKRLAGSGHEADDGDNGQADLIVFKIGDHIFIALTHDEDLPPSAHQDMLTTVQTATAP